MDFELGLDLLVRAGQYVEGGVVTIGYRPTGFDYFDSRKIRWNECWHRVPREVLGFEFVLTLHFSDAIDLNRTETIRNQGNDPALASGSRNFA